MNPEKTAPHTMNESMHPMMTHFRFCQTALKQIGCISAEMLISYMLENQIYPSNLISVKMEGGNITQQGVNSWTYNSVTNMIEFSSNGITKFGETIVTTYEITGEHQN